MNKEQLEKLRMELFENLQIKRDDNCRHALYLEKKLHAVLEAILEEKNEA